jgi:protein-disulfide isomerase
MVIALLCLAATLVFWLQTRAEIQSLRSAQRQLGTELAALRQDPIIDVAGAPALGPADAVVTLVEFSDYECPFCVRHFTQTMPRLEQEFINTGKIRYVFKDFPIDQLHPAAIRAHEAGRCAAEQDRFWDMHRRLFSAPGTHGDEALLTRAREVGLNVDSFRECLSSGRTTAAVRQAVSVAASLGANGTPSFFVGVRDLDTDHVKVLRGISGAQPFEVFARAIAEVTDAAE